MKYQVRDITDIQYQYLQDMSMMYLQHPTWEVAVSIRTITTGHITEQVGDDTFGILFAIIDLRCRPPNLPWAGAARKRQM